MDEYDRRPFSLRRYLQEGAADEDRTATNWCLRVSVVVAVIVTGAFFVAQLHEVDSTKLKLYGALGVAFGTLIITFLVVSILLALFRRIHRGR
jgi:hypothetical protein